MKIVKTIIMFGVLSFAGAIQAQPSISNVYVQSSTATTATIVWTTSTPSTSQILYGTSIFLQYSNNVNGALVTSHTSTLTVLNANQPYYFAAVSVDGSNRSTQSLTYVFSLCGQPFVPVIGTINQFYYSGTYTLTWNPPAGSSGTPTVCGQTFPTTITGTVNLSGSFSSLVADSTKVTPGPGTWTVAVADIGDISPISVSIPLSSLTQDISTQLQTAAAGTSLVGVIANNNAHTVYPPWIGSGGSGDTITSPNSTLSVGGSSSATTLDINLAHANTWTALQTFGTHISIGGVTPAGATGTGNLVFATSPTLGGTIGGSPTANGTWTFSAANALTLSAMSGTSCLEEVSGVVTATGSACGSGGSGPTLQTNGANNASQSTLNFLTSTTNAAGLIVTPSNPTLGNEQYEITTVACSLTGVGSGIACIGGTQAAAPTSGTSSTDWLASGPSGWVECIGTTGGCPLLLTNYPADTTVAVPAATFNANSCTVGTNSPLTMTGLTTTMTVSFTANSDTHATTGWGAPGAGVLYITNYPSASNTVTFYVCNNTSSNITTSASQTFNVSAR